MRCCLAAPHAWSISRAVARKTFQNSCGDRRDTSREQQHFVFVILLPTIIAWIGNWCRRRHTMVPDFPKNLKMPKESQVALICFIILRTKPLYFRNEILCVPVSQGSPQNPRLAPGLLNISLSYNLSMFVLIAKNRIIHVRLYF